MAKAATAEGIRVRKAERADITQLRELCRQLGYPSSEEQVRARAAAIETATEHALFVAEESGGAVVGLVDVFVSRTIESDPRGEIGGLIVDENRRSRGVGELLMARAEAWTREKGCGEMRVRSNVVRERAHAFYERIGYQHVKTQKTFSKYLQGQRGKDLPERG